MLSHRHFSLKAAVLTIVIAGPATIAGPAGANDGPASTAPAAPAPPEPTEPTGQLIEGIVLNHYGGGIAGARVRIESLDASPDDPPLAEGTANGFGDIAIRLPGALETPVRVRIRAEGYTDWVREIDPSNQENPPFIDATLEGAARLTGTVRAKDTSRPAAGARIRCDNGGRDLAALTDGEGRYAINNVTRGPATLTVSAEGFGIERRMVMVRSEWAGVDIELQPERLVEFLVVTSDGEPAADLTIEAVVDPMNYYLHTATDAAGRATLRGVTAGADLVHVRLNGPQYVRMPDFSTTIPLSPARRTSTAPASAPAPVRRRLVAAVAATVVGKVTDAESHKPILGVRVIAGRQVSAVMPMAWTSSDGTYELTGVRPGIVTVSFQHGDYATAIREANLYTGKRCTVDVRLAAGLVISGTVVDEDGDPLEQVWVSGEDWQGYSTLGLRTLTGEDGRFSLPHAPPGEIEFSFVKPGCGPPVQEVLTAGRTDYRIVLEVMALSSPPGPRPDLLARVPIGKTVPELTMTATDGVIYKLSELRGKYVFIDCWASWCGPCMVEVRNIKTLYEAMKDRPDFVLLGVSLDHDREAFRKVVEDHEMDWPQVFGEKSGARETFEILNGRMIPYACLIGPDGKMLAQQLRGPTIIQEVREHLAK